LPDHTRRHLTFDVATARRARIGHASVADQSVRRAMKIAFETLKLVAESSAAVALAALFEAGEAMRGKSVLCHATGGNTAFYEFARIVSA
jgi:threonine dehydratase